MMRRAARLACVASPSSTSNGLGAVSRSLSRPFFLAASTRSYYADTLSTKHEGEAGSVDHRVFFADSEGDIISPWHDIPLRVQSKDLVNLVVEIPRGEKAKYEISTGHKLNPIEFDLNKHGEPRFYPFKSLVNYGALPQTWEDPDVVDPRLQLGGDNDPVDVCEIGSKVARVGDVYPVKLLGAIAMLDEGEVDWKLLAIRASDPLADKVNSLEDVKTHFGTIVEDLIHWFRVYKVPEGKPENEFGFDGIPQEADVAKTVVAETHEAWQKLVSTTSESSGSFGYNVLKETAPGLWVPPPSTAELVE